MMSKKDRPRCKTGKMNGNVSLLLSQASNYMHEPIVPMNFLVLGVHVSGAKFMYPDLIWKELCGKKGNLPSNSCLFERS